MSEVVKHPKPESIWSNMELKQATFEPVPIEIRTPDRTVICHCELAMRPFVLKAGETGCELCCKEQGWQDFTPENVNKVFTWCDEEICKLQTELYNKRDDDTQ